MPREEEEEGKGESGSRSSGAMRSRRRTPAATPTSPTVTTRSRASQSEPPPPSTTLKGRKRSRASGGCEDEPPTASKGRKRSMASGGREDEPPSTASKGRKRSRASGGREDEPPSTASKARKRSRASGGHEDDETAEQEASPALVSPPAEHASSGDSSAVSSPLCWPVLPGAVIRGQDPPGHVEPVMKMKPGILDAYDRLTWKCNEKKGRQMKLATLYAPESVSCLVNEEFIPTRESATKTVLKAAKVVMSLSSYVDGVLLNQTSGFVINWDRESKIGTILTSALIICSKHSSRDEWSGTRKYIPEAEVRVHLLDKDDSVAVANLIHFDKNYSLAVFKAVMNLSTEVHPFCDAKFGQEVFVLGRDKNLDLNIDHGLVPYKGPTTFERNHYMFINCALKRNECGNGGPVIDLNGEVVGMVINIWRMGFIPSSFIIKCLHMLSKFNCVPRLHIGMKLSSIKFLDPIRVERISRKCNVDSGLIVKAVSHGSITEELGVRPGDIIQSMNGECITTTVELENLLMRICENHLDQGCHIGSSVDIQVGIFHIRQGSSCSTSLKLPLSDDVEMFVFTLCLKETVIQVFMTQWHTALDDIGLPRIQVACVGEMIFVAARAIVLAIFI
ncbi:hypothetical protein U9M48_044012 [Paspalum notatum var. saurae]|uniref:PDZ domain-containing protein n=1 Tax=Paspalum notatum var. saurae TaxID=547442 RepID=A0AAQ3XHR9_PASNO